MNMSSATHSRFTLLAMVLALTWPASVLAQGGGQQQADAPAINQATNPLLRGFTWRSIGPIGQGGRVDDLEVVEGNPSTWYVGFATGGLWKTTNMGTTFDPIFDTYSTHSIGDIAISASNPEIVYVGTGESNNRQSSSFGDGMYKTTDGGQTFTQIGLRETQSIARVIVHPTNPDIVWVAANGHLFGPNPERGVFKTTNGGQSWSKVLYVNENTGATDLVIDPSNPNTLLAATYQRQRTAWGFASGGGGSGIWRSEDGGNTWSRLVGAGLPAGTMGRIALAISLSDPNVVYAQIEVAPDKEPVAQQAGQQGGGRGGNQPPDPNYNGIWRSADNGRTWEFRSNQNGRPMYFSQIRVSTEDPDLVYVVDQNVHKSTDGARTFERLSGYGHVDQHAVWIDPANHDHMMIGNDGSVDVTWDQGETWESLRTWAVGQPYHASVDMRRPYYVCTGLQDNGSWCGPSSVRSGPILSQDWYRVGGGDGFYSIVDPTDHTVVYVESQGGAMSRLDLESGESRSIRPRGPSQNNPAGNIRPTPSLGLQLRFNWSTPIVMSPHNPRTIYTGANRLFISRDRGDTWTMTEDLTRQIDRDQRSIMGMPGTLPRCSRLRNGPCINSENDGTSRFGTIVTIAESPVLPGVLWAGTDDGAIQVSRDGGTSWSEVSANLPGGAREYYISRVEASHFDAATAYVSVDGHRSDDLMPYIYVTTDYGQSWTAIANDLPAFGNVNTIREDPQNPDLLYAGTEFGFFVSLDRGSSWNRFMTDLPVVRIDDVVVHPRDNDLVLATHGRSIMVMDDVTPLQQLTPDVLAEDVWLFEPRNAVLWKQDVRKRRSVTGDENFEGQNAPPGTAISYYLGAAPGGAVRLSITDPMSGEVFRDLETTAEQGLNRIRWNLRGNPPPPQPGQGGGQRQGPLAQPGTYLVTLSVGNREYTSTVTVEEDIWMNQR